MRTTGIVATVVMLVSGFLPATAQTITVQSLLSEMASMDPLVESLDPPYTTALASSYDRSSVAPSLPGWFANMDLGNFIRVEQNEGRTEWVMMDALGPGAVVRIWTANPWGRTLRIYIDGASQAEIEVPMGDLLSGDIEPFHKPLAHITSRGYNLYFPIPYSQSCKVTVDSLGSGDPFYHVTYRTYAQGTTVQSFSLAGATALEGEIRQVAQALVQSKHGDVFRDSTSNEIHGFLAEGDADSNLAAPGRIGRAVDLSGDYVDLWNPAQLPDGTGGRSLCAWAKPDTTPASGFRWIAGYGSGLPGRAMSIGMVEFSAVGGAGGDKLVHGNFWDADWHHICLTYDGARAYLYGDGQLLRSRVASWNLLRDRAYLGRQVGGNLWDGSIDEVRIANSALSAQWIATSYNNQSSPSTFYSIGALGISPVRGWNHRKRITIDHTTVSGSRDLIGFPVVFAATDPDLRTVAEGGGVAQENGGDIRFTAGDGTTRLDHEIEVYERSSGELVAWVKIPLLSPRADTDFYVEYGNPIGALDEQNAGGVWDATYAGVWHLNDPGFDPLWRTPSTSGQLVVNGGASTVAVPAAVGRDALVRELRLKPSATDEDTLRKTLLQISFDGQTTVRTPLGDFFGSGPGWNAYDSLPISVESDGTLVSRWPMAFQDSMTLELSSVSGTALTVDYDVLFDSYAWSADSLYFHAGWRPDHQVQAHPIRDWNLVTVLGKGHYVGTLLNVTNPFIDIWWGEGDEKVWVDGGAFPGHFGTGTEDYFGYAWGRLAAPFEHAYHNQTRLDGDRIYGRASVNRWHVFDPVTFDASLQFDLEQLAIAYDDRAVLFDATSYWYADAGSSDNMPVLTPSDLTISELPALLERKVCGIAVEGEGMAILANPGSLSVQAMSPLETEGRLWSDHLQLFGRNAVVSEQFVLGFDVAEAGEYDVRAYMTRAYDYGIFQLYLNGQAAGASIDLYADEIAPTEGIELGAFSLSAGENTLTAEIVGQNPGNPFPDRFYLGLDALSLLLTASLVSPTLTVEPSQLSWTPTPLTIGYDVLRGNLQALRDSGDFGQAIDACLADNRDATSLPYAVDPLPGEALFFLVGDACTGTFDSEAGQQGSRDPGINASPNSCS